MKTGRDSIDLAKELGAFEEPSGQRLTLYIPDRDRDGNAIEDIKKWNEGAREVLTKIGGGSTALPPADGTWQNPDSGDIIWEKTTIIYTMIDPDKFIENINSLRSFLHLFGKQTNQGEVVVEFSGRLYKIRAYD